MSRGGKKRDDSLKMGSDDFVSTDHPEDIKRIFKKNTHIICTEFIGILNGSHIYLLRVTDMICH